MPLYKPERAPHIGGNVKCGHINKITKNMDTGVEIVAPALGRKDVVIDLDDNVPPHTIKLLLCDNCWQGFVEAVETAKTDENLKVHIK